MTTKVPAGMLGFDPATQAELDAKITVPIGAGVDYWGATLPSGFLWADGSAVSRTTYAALFAVLGTTHGAGDGTTTFNLPDKRGRVSAARDDLGGSAANRLTAAVSGITATSLGAAGGDQRAPAHTHGITDPGHIHSVDPPSSSDTSGSGLTAAGTGGAEDISAFNSGSATTGITINSAGEGTAQNVQPTIVCNYIIRAL